LGRYGTRIINFLKIADKADTTAIAQAIIMALLCVGFALGTKPALAMMVAMFFLFDDAFAVRYISLNPVLIRQ
jgi:hypothetical protein